MPRKKKYPKKPKANASVRTMENYLKARKEVDKYNAHLESEKKKKASLRARISRL